MDGCVTISQAKKLKKEARMDIFDKLKCVAALCALQALADGMTRLHAGNLRRRFPPTCSLHSPLRPRSEPATS